MNNLEHKLHNRRLRQNRVRAVVSGTAKRPRLSVFVSERHVTAQLIDDASGKTLGYVTTVGQKSATGTLTNKAEWVGEQIAARAKSVKIKHVVFDRNGRKYHGRLKALAERARKEGLEF